MILFYRGSWCPYCNEQLAAYSKAAEDFSRDEIKVVAISADDRDAAEAMVDKHGITFPVGYGAIASEVASATGAAVNDDPVAVQATGFILDPDGRVVTAVYSTRAIGRLMPDEVLGFIRYLRAKSKS